MIVALAAILTACAIDHRDRSPDDVSDTGVSDTDAEEVESSAEGTDDSAVPESSDSTRDGGAEHTDAATDASRDAAADATAAGRCGDREVTPGLGEQCDDGNLDDTDECNNDCHLPARVLWSHENEANVFATSLAVDDAGAIAIGGNFVRTGPTTDLWVHKYTPSGSAAWPRAQTLDVGSAESAEAVTFAPGGDVVVLGSTQVLGSRAASGIVLMKYASGDGTRRWTEPVRTMTGQEHVGTTVFVSPTQQIYALATFRAESRLDVWLQAFDAMGGTLWPSAIQRDEGQGEFPGAFWLASDNVLRAYWAATPGPVMQLVMADVSRSDGAITTRLAPLSAMTISNPLYFAVDAQGSVVVCGNVSMGQKRALWVQKLSSDGAPVWHSEVLETADDSLVCGGVALDRLGNVAVIAYLGTMSKRVWLRVYTADGQPRWRTPVVYDGGYQAFPAGVGFDPEGNVIAAGARRTPENYSFLWLAKYAR